MTLEESDFFCVVKHVSMVTAVFSLHFLLDSREFAEGRRDKLDNETAYQVPKVHDSWALPANRFGKFLREKHDVKQRLCEVLVKIRHRISPAFNVLRKPLVWILNTRVQIRDLVEYHALHVLVVEVECEALAEASRN